MFITPPLSLGGQLDNIQKLVARVVQTVRKRKGLTNVKNGQVCEDRRLHVREAGVQDPDPGNLVLVPPARKELPEIPIVTAAALDTDRPRRADKDTITV